MAQQTQINGNRYSFTSISMEAVGLGLSSGDYLFPKGILQSINYTGAQEPGVVQGNQIVPVGLTAGMGQGSGDMEILASEFDDFAQGLTNNGQFPLMSVDFLITVSYSENDVDVRTDQLRGVRITNVASDNTKGNDASTKKLTLFIRQINLNGIDLYADPTT